MKNVYGSKLHKDYIDKYLEYLVATFEDYVIEHKSYQYNQYQITIEQYKYQNKMNFGERAELKILDKNIKIYEASLIETSMVPTFITIFNKLCVIFRKTLFGFTVFNLIDKTEYNFFPQNGLKNEAFIVDKAWIFKDILVFEGCYWGAEYGYYFFQLGSEKGYYFSNHCDDYFSSSCTVKPQIFEDGIVLTNDDGNYLTISYKEICANLRDKE